VRRPEEGLGGRRAPVDEQPVPVARGQPEPPDVHRLGPPDRVHASQAEVEAIAPQRPQAGGQPVHLEVPLHRLLAPTPGSPARGVEAGREVVGRLVQCRGDLREVLLVAGDEQRVGLGGQVVG
jgi:hypothetical protein